MLKTLTTFLSSRLRSNPVMDRIEVVKVPRYGVCDKNPSVVVQVMPDGKRTRGTLDNEGMFKPLTEDQQ